MDYCWKCGSPMTKNSKKRVCSSCGRTVQRHKNSTSAYNDTSSSGSGGVFGTLLGIGLVGLALAFTKKNQNTDDIEDLDLDDYSLHSGSLTRGDEYQMQGSEITEKVRLQELEYKERKDKRDIMIGLIGVCVPLLIVLAIIIGFGVNKGVSQMQGKISAGHHEDYVGEKYEAVVKQFEEMGFTNITTVDLKDSGLAFWNNGKVKSVSINGNDSFEDFNYFYPDAKVIIKYH